MFRARVPTGSESHLSGKRFAAQWTTTFGLYRWGIVLAGLDGVGREGGRGSTWFRSAHARRRRWN